MDETKQMPSPYYTYGKDGRLVGKNFAGVLVVNKDGVVVGAFPDTPFGWNNIDHYTRLGDRVTAGQLEDSGYNLIKCGGWVDGVITALIV